jgi:hypothetical protein
MAAEWVENLVVRLGRKWSRYSDYSRVFRWVHSKEQQSVVSWEKKTVELSVDS